MCSLIAHSSLLSVNFVRTVVMQCSNFPGCVSAFLVSRWSRSTMHIVHDIVCAECWMYHVYHHLNIEHIFKRDWLRASLTTIQLQLLNVIDSLLQSTYLCIFLSIYLSLSFYLSACGSCIPHSISYSIFHFNGKRISSFFDSGKSTSQYHHSLVKLILYWVENFHLARNCIQNQCSEFPIPALNVFPFFFIYF